jgi:hypothetical protein
MKRGGKESKLYVALVTPGSSAGVKYRHGVALASFFSCDMWVPLSVTEIGSVLRVYGVVCIITSQISPIAYRHCITETDVEISTS